MHLKLRHLAVFHAVMEEGSISRAATKMGLTQPAVSMALTKLEEILGYSLFNRSKGHLVPRPEAELLRPDAELAILAFERFASHAESIGKGAEGMVRIGAIGSTSVHFMPALISRFSETRAKVEVELQVRSSAQIAYLVGNGQIDVGLVEAPVSAQSVDAINIDIPCVCILREDDPLAAAKVVTPQMLAGRPFISVNENHPLDWQVRAAFIQSGALWKSQIRSYFFAVMRNLVATGAGVAVVDAINGCAEIEDGVIWRPFEPRILYQIALITRSDRAPTGPAREFMDLTRARLEDYERLSRAHLDARG